MSSTAHIWPIRVYFEDTDFSGNVYHAAYLKFMERARTEFLRALGVHHFELNEEGLVFAVRHMEIFFDGPARIDDLLQVESEPVLVGGARLALRQTVRRGTEVLVRAEVTVAMVNRSGRATRLPRSVRDALEQGD